MLTPDFGTCQGRVLQRWKGSASYDRWIWRGDRVPRSKILLTEEEKVDQICRLRFGKSYLIFRIALPWSARIVLAWGINMSPPAIIKMDTHPTNTNLLYLQFTFSLAASPSFSFPRVLSSWSWTPHIRATWFAGKFLFTEQIWALAFGRIAMASFRSIQNLPNLSKLWSRAHRCFLV